MRDPLSNATRERMMAREAAAIQKLKKKREAQRKRAAVQVERVVELLKAAPRGDQR